MAKPKIRGKARGGMGAPGGSGHPPRLVRVEPRLTVEATPVIYQPPRMPLDVTCRSCGEPLATWAMALGICGDCLHASQQVLRTVPQPGYRGH